MDHLALRKRRGQRTASYLVATRKPCHPVGGHRQFPLTYNRCKWARHLQMHAERVTLRFSLLYLQRRAKSETYINIQ